MTEETQATLRASVNKFEQLIHETSLDGDVEHSDLYLNICDNEVSVLQSAPGEVVLTYGSYGYDYFDSLEVEVDQEEVEIDDGAGGTVPFEKGCQAAINVNETERLLSYASDGDKTIELDFIGEDSNELASKIEVSGSINTWRTLPGSKKVLDEVPRWLPSRFTDEYKFTSPSGNETPTVVNTDVSNIEKIIDAVEQDIDDDYYPIVVRDGKFLIDIESSKMGLHGELGSTETDGPDVENYYFDGFQEIMNVLSGRIELQTAPDNAPLSVVRQGSSSEVVAHVNGSVNV